MHHEWLYLKAKTRYYLVCSLLFLLYKENNWLAFHCVSKDSLKWCVSTPGICFFPNTEPPWCFITLFIAVKFRSTKHLTKKTLQSWYSSGEALETMWCLEDKGLLFSMAKWDYMTLADQFWAYQTCTDLTIDARWQEGTVSVKKPVH